MLKRLSLGFFSFSILLSYLPNTYAEQASGQVISVRQLMEQAHELHLANELVWQKIILFNHHAEVTSKGFYLSDLDAKNINSMPALTHSAKILRSFANIQLVITG
jgi:hypothetical protein